MERMGSKNSLIKDTKNNLKRVTLYCDGACSNQMYGGWGAILIYNGVEKELWGGANNTTNNRMEMTAVIKGLEALKERCEVDVYSDSQYVIGTMTKGWKRNKNHELWKELDKLVAIHRVHFNWIKGHNGNYYNERCDELAKRGKLDE